MFYLSLAILIIVLAANAVLGLSIYLRLPNKPVNIYFGLLVLSLDVWAGSSFYDQTASTLMFIENLAALPFIGAIFVAVFFNLFALYFPERQQSSRLSKLLIGICLTVTTIPLIGLFLETDQIVGGVSAGPQGNRVLLGPLYFLFVAYFVLWMGVALINLGRKFIKADHKLEKAQLSFIFIGFFLSVLV